MKKLLYLAMMLFALVSCGNGSQKEQAAQQADTLPTDSIQSVVGAWIQPVPGQDTIQGYNFKADGSAESINMKTLVAQSWKQEGDSLYVVEKSIGNGKEFIDTTAWKVVTLNKDSLVLMNGNGTQAFARKK